MVAHRATTPTRVGENAVVIGASIAGLCAARVLADRFDSVTVVDRDTLPDGPTWRRRVPQGRHPHLLLAFGARLLEGWFPGVVDQLYAGGAVEIDLVADMYWYQGGGVARRPPSSLRGPSMSRPFLEWTVRTRLASMTNVTVRGDSDVKGLQLDATGGRVVAVRLAGGLLPCDLVVDATGRQAHTFSWLEQLGYPQPAVSRVEIDTRYLTQQFRQTTVRSATGRRPASSTTRQPSASPWPPPRGQPLAGPVRWRSRRDRSRRS